MCGIFFNFNLKKKTGKKQSELYKRNFQKYLSQRGPNGYKEVIENNCYFLHSRLQITGDVVQPVEDLNKILLFNGEIYNDWRKYNKNYSDTNFLSKFIDKNNFSNFDKLDGEYSIIILEKKKKFLHIITDPFGTKPIYLAKKKNDLFVCSYDKSLEDLKINKKKIYSINPNTHIKIKLTDNFPTEKKFPLKKFTFNSKKKTNYKDFEKALIKSIKKRAQRVQQKILLPLSSGIDSGLIAGLLNKLNINFSSYSIKYGEDENIIKQRYEILRKSKKNNFFNIKITKKIASIEKRYLMKNSPFYNINIDYKPYLYDDYRMIDAFHGLSRIFRLAKKNKEYIVLSGQGADEIISDYYAPGTNSRRSCFRGNWKLCNKPWFNFYNGWNKTLIAINERIGGSHGLETRYPFLDFNLVQSFLSLPNNLKGKYYKAPMVEILKKIRFPFHNKKIGMAAYNQKRKIIKNSVRTKNKL